MYPEQCFTVNSFGHKAVCISVSVAIGRLCFIDVYASTSDIVRYKLFLSTSLELHGTTHDNVCEYEVVLR